MDKDNNEKHGIAHEIGVLEMKQSELDHRISRRTIKYNKLTEVLNQSELGYSKVVDSLQVLLNFASKESKTIDEPEPPK